MTVNVKLCTLYLDLRERTEHWLAIDLQHKLQNEVRTMERSI